MSIDGKVSIVTGVTSGLGRGIATVFARQGSRVIGTGRRVSLGKALEEEVRGSGGELTFIEADVTRVADCSATVEAAVREYGRVDVLVNNAGFEGDPPVQDSHAVTEDQWDAVVDTNLKGAFFCSRAALPVMRSQGGGVILNIASINAIDAQAHQAAYNASKAGLVQLSRTLAVEYLFDGIRVNAIIMGGVDSPQAERTRDSYARYVRGPDFVRSDTRRSPMMQDPEDVGRTLAVLCHDDAHLITGATIAIDRTISAGFPTSTMVHLTSAEIWTTPDV